ncbi:MAG: glucose 1-dehydrogenase [Synergistetes bacterium]|nr:glucose 1-dehydrogenase [Synergistota bacterium]MDW8193150.1 glucose 1-dehydrogenase [Synergistota bacterium]
MRELKANLIGKVALITGGSKGIGKAITMALAECGAKVAIASRTFEDLQKVKREIEEKGGKCFTVTGDVSKVSDCYEIVEKTYQHYGKLDILVNSAGINIPKPALEVTEEDWEKVLSINLKGTFFCSQAAAKKMILQRKGKIINITSQMAFVGFYKRAAYCASKGGVTQLTKVLAIEWAPYNINVNCVAPTFIYTPMTKPMFEDKDFHEEVLRRIPMGRIGNPEDVVGAVIYLSSEDSNLVTGSTILVDGGWVAW